MEDLLAVVWELQADIKATKAGQEEMIAEMKARLEKMEAKVEAVAEHYEGYHAQKPWRNGLLMFCTEILMVQHTRRMSGQPRTDLGSSNWP
jgi:HD superfamily phosphodiesterase